MDRENEYEGKVVLVTGGAGCIGTNICIVLGIRPGMINKRPIIL